MYEFPCETPVTAEIRVSAGRCDVIAEQRDTVTVDVLPVDDDERSVQAAAETTVSFSGNALLVKTPDTNGVGWLFGRRTARLRVTVRIPLDSTVDTKTASADLTCTGRLATLAIGNASGNVHADQVSGDVAVNTASGDVQLGQIGGSLKITSASGDLTVDFVGGDVVGNSASGDTTLGRTQGSVKLHSASGDVRIGSARGGKIKASTASGDVAVGVPAGTGVWLDLNTASGTTSSDLTVGGETPLSGHDLELRVSTASGDIEVHRVPATADA
ncbi:MAG: DUF4097 family beta strand repeat-containing protein [Actinocatenispora sp.]